MKWLRNNWGFALWSALILAGFAGIIALRFHIGAFCVECGVMPRDAFQRWLDAQAMAAEYYEPAVYPRASYLHWCLTGECKPYPEPRPVDRQPILGLAILAVILIAGALPAGIRWARRWQRDTKVLAAAALLVFGALAAEQYFRYERAHFCHQCARPIELWERRAVEMEIGYDPEAVRPPLSFWHWYWQGRCCP